MIKKTNKKLTLNRSAIRHLTGIDLTAIIGGAGPTHGGGCASNKSACCTEATCP